jgi:hypothetical protein
MRILDEKEVVLRKRDSKKVISIIFRHWKDKKQQNNSM